MNQIKRKSHPPMAELLRTITTFAQITMVCPDCEADVDCDIPVRVGIRSITDTHHELVAAVDTTAAWAQPYWDHRLKVHGPQA